MEIDARADRRRSDVRTPMRTRRGSPPARFKRILVILLVLGAVSAVSCGGGNDDKEEAPQPATKQPADTERTRPERGLDARRSRGRERRRGRDADRQRKRRADQRDDDRRATGPGPSDEQPEDTGQTEDQPPQQEEEAPSRRRPREERRLERVLLNRFGGGEGQKAPWYDDIEGVEVIDGTTTIKVAIRGGDASGVAYEICSSVIGLIPGTTDVVRVRDSSGKTLRKCVP
jgi:hypothetical protein